MRRYSVMRGKNSRGRECKQRQVFCWVRITKTDTHAQTHTQHTCERPSGNALEKLLSVLSSVDDKIIQYGGTPHATSKILALN